MSEQISKEYVRTLMSSIDGVLGFLDRIRAAAGDPEGKLTRDELVEHIRSLREDSEHMFEVVPQLEELSKWRDVAHSLASRLRSARAYMERRLGEQSFIGSAALDAYKKLKDRAKEPN